MLIVQATGSGKTRVSISIVDVLMRHNIIKNVLFLADRTTLVKQAKNNFNNLLPGVSLCNLLDAKDNPTFSYELDQAVEEGFLVDYGTIEVKSKIMENGIHYDELSEEDKEEFEKIFEDDEEVTDFVSSNAINEWLFNMDTIVVY